MMPVRSELSWPLNGGETGSLIRAFDWSGTSLGPIASWPAHLRITVDTIVNSPVPQVLMWGPDHVMIYNDGYIEIAGQNHPRALGASVPDIWPEIWDWNERILAAGLRGEVQSFRDQPMVLRRSGQPEEVTFDLFYTPVHAEDGTVDGVLCTVIENTERARTARELARSEAELRGVTAALPMLIGFIDRDHVSRFANPYYREWFGKDPAEIVGRHIRETIGAENYEKRLPDMKKALRGETVENDEVIVRLDGERRAGEIRYIPRRDIDGEVDGFYVLMLDIEDRKRTENALRLSNSRFEAAIDAIRGVLWTNSADGQMIGEQPGWARLTGQSFEVYQGFGWSDAVHPDDRAGSIESWNKAVAAKSIYVWEHRVRRRDGIWRTCAIRAVPILTAKGDIAEWVGVHSDITEQREAEAALREHADALERQVRHRIRAEEQLRQLNENLEARVIAEIAERRQAEIALQQAQKMETIGKLTGGVAHDFNNLLQVVSGNLQLLSRDIAGNERAERRVTNALAGVSRGAKLASQLLAFGRRQALEPKVVNIGRFMAGIDDMLRRAIGESVEVETVVSGGLWNTFIDPTQIENAVLNLAINARDAMDGTGRLTIEVGNAALDDAYAQSHAEVVPGQYVMLAVSDTGTGIPADILEQVFEPFFSTKPEGKGTGLGLSMVYGFVKQSGGHVKIYSEVGHGTTVRLYLPRALDAEDVEVEVATGPISGGSETILVVEDDDSVRATVVDLLGELGYGVLKAVDAQSALNVIESGVAIDLLFTDVVMPGTLKSPELARKARERLPHLAVLFTSGYTENSIVHGGRLDAGVELLSKPYSREALARKIRLVLAGQKERPATAPGRDEPPVAPEPDPAPALLGPAKLTVLLVEDDPLIRTNSAELLKDFGHLVVEAGSAEEAMAALQSVPVDVLFTDLGLPGLSGDSFAQKARVLRPKIGIVFATGNETAPDLAETGTAAILLRKPYDSAGIAAALAAAVQRPGEVPADAGAGDPAEPAATAAVRAPAR